MSKKNKRRRQRKTFPWPLLVGGGILLILAAFFVFSNGGANGGTPAITVDQPAIDYGYVPFGNNKTFAITVTNTGDGTLRFKDKPYIEVLEGC